MKTIYTTSSFFNWIFACLMNVLLIYGCARFAAVVDWHYLDMAFFLYLVIFLMYLICLKIDEGFPALFRKFFLRKKIILLHIPAYEVTLILVGTYHLVKAIYLYKDALLAIF
jgi:hypothetical protein